MRQAKKIPASLRTDRIITTLIGDRRRGVLNKTSYHQALEHTAAEDARHRNPPTASLPRVSEQAQETPPQAGGSDSETDRA